MSCIVSLIIGEQGRDKVVRRGTEPRSPVTWRIAAWFVLASGEKHTHSATIQHETVSGLVPAMGQLIDSLVADHGNSVPVRAGRQQATAQSGGANDRNPATALRENSRQA